MGRVYKALLKAERVKDGERPIGLPARPFRAQAEFRPAERGPSRTPDSAASFDISRRVATRGGASAAERFDFKDTIALSEKVAAAQHSRVAAPQPPPVVVAHVSPDRFEEPRTVRNADDLEIAPHLAALNGKDRLACERYRMLGVRLLNLGARRKLKTVLITSSEEGEGKSTIASNLAWSIARPSGRRVLLIDANHDSRSSLSSLFGVQTVRGWVGVAEGRCQFADASVRLNPNGLCLLMRGSIEAARNHGSSAADDLSTTAFEKLIERLENDFDVVIIDSPPILNSGGTQRLASLVDGTLFVVRAGHTHHSAVTEGLTLVPPDRQLGLVLNESDIDDENTRGREKRNTRR
jgi:Mrp family chromosome partitioning ATPase